MSPLLLEIWYTCNPEKGQFCASAPENKVNFRIVAFVARIFVMDNEV